MNRPTVLSLFSGIGGFDLAFERHGFQTVAFSEVDPFACAVLAHHWPGVPNLGDVTKIDARALAGQVDVVTFGAPCQDLSVAGKREGLKGERSGLFFEAVRIVAECGAALAIYENVPGLLSSNRGRDFGAVLDALADIGAVDIAWGTLDAQWFGVPQRRRRVFVVADFRGERAGEILAECDGLRGHPAPRRETGEGVTRSLMHGAGGGRYDKHPLSFANTGSETWSESEPRLGAHPGRQYDALIFDEQQVTCPDHRVGYAPGRPAPPLTDGMRLRVAHSLRADGFDATEDGTGRGAPLVPVAWGISSDALDRSGEGDGTAGERAGLGIVADAAPSLRARSNNAVAFSSKDYGADTGETVPTLRAMGHEDSHANGGGQVAVSHQFGVRRLSPRECERLMGLPDDFTLIPYRGKPAAADGPRYRSLGNSVAIPVVEWIARRMATALRQKRAA